MVKLVENTNNFDIDTIWAAVCSNDFSTMMSYLYDNKGNPNVKYHRFGKDHSLVMGALRNNNYRMAKLLLDNGAKISSEEAKELEHLEIYQVLTNAINSVE